MNSTCAWPALVAALFLSAGSLRAGDWKTSDGKVYEDVKLIKLDADTVTILHKNGGAQIPLAKLSPDLQARFGYDPELAKAAADARAKEAALNAQLMQAEMDKASAMHQAGQESDTASLATSDEATGPTGSHSQTDATTTTTATHHFIDEVATSSSVKKANASHHSIDDATQASVAMRRDLSDPTYHTMAHMFYTVRTTRLSPDAGDTTHHTIGEVNAAANAQK